MMQSIPFILATRLRPTRGRAFTLTELILGMAVTTLVMAATGALMTSVARGWEQSTSAQNGSNSVMQAHVRLQRILRSARQVGACRTGTIDGTTSARAALLLWKADANGDGLVQFSEVALLEHEIGATPAQSRLLYYEIVYPDWWTEAQKLAADGDPLDDDRIFLDQSITSFKSSEYAVPRSVADYVIGAQFSKHDGKKVVRPFVHYLLNVQKNDWTELEYGTVSVRAAAPLPASQRVD